MLPRTVILFWLLAVLVYHDCNAVSTPVFLKAISSALGAIPLSGFPMSLTSGLTGAKLAVGAKLLYYLGYFGQGGRNTPPVRMTATKARPPMTGVPFSSGSPFAPPGLGGFQGFGGQGFGGQGFAGQGFVPPQAQFAAPPAPSVDPSVLFQALAAQGINPLQLMQALTAAGIDPAQLLQSLGGGQPGFAGNMAGPGVPMPPVFPPQIPQQMPSPISQQMPQDFSHSFAPEDSPADPEGPDGTEDIESFFSFLRDMDDNKCISRLICDIGKDPAFLGEFTQNIDSIISSLEVPPESGANEYIRIMNAGKEGADCAAQFTECTDGEYEIVKSVAPSVGVPGMSAAAEN